MQRICESQQLMERKYGHSLTKVIMRRLIQLKAIGNLRKLESGVTPISCDRLTPTSSKFSVNLSTSNYLLFDIKDTGKCLELIDEIHILDIRGKNE